MEWTKDNLIGEFVRHKHSGEVARVDNITQDEYGVYQIKLFGFWYPVMSYFNFKDFLSEFNVCPYIKLAIQDNILRQVVYDALKGASIYTAFTSNGSYTDMNNIHIKFQAILGDIVSGIKEREQHI